MSLLKTIEVKNTEEGDAVKALVRVDFFSFHARQKEENREKVVVVEKANMHRK